MVVLRTERLLLRPIDPTDTASFLALAGDWSVARMTSDIPHPLPAREAPRWTSPPASELRLAMILEREMIGAVGYFRDTAGIAELGYWLGRPWWGMGLATEAARAVVVHGFTRDRLPGFSASFFADNPASQRVLDKLGFRVTGEVRIWCEARRAEMAAVTCWLDPPARASSRESQLAHARAESEPRKGDRATIWSRLSTLGTPHRR